MAAFLDDIEELIVIKSRQAERISFYKN
jgi:hypothetical protein